MASFNRFEDIEVWRCARLLSSRIYGASARGDWAGDYGLRDQVRRAAVSIMSNIAEGFERHGNVEFIRFLVIAKSSCAELRSQLYVAFDVGYISESEFESLREEAECVARMISGLIKYLKGSVTK